MDTLPFPRRISLQAVMVVSGILYLLLYLSWLLWGRSVPYERFLIGNLSLVFTALLAAGLALWIRGKLSLPQTNRSSAAVRLRSAWNWLAMGLALWAFGDVARMVYQAISPFSMTPSVTVSPQNGAVLQAVSPQAILPLSVFGFSTLDILYLLGSLPVWIGLLIYPRQPRKSFGRLGLMLDSLLTTAAALTLVWLAVIEPALSSITSAAGGAPNGASYLGAVLYPLSDLVLLLLLMNLFLLSDPHRLPKPFGWISLGLAAYTYSDLIYASLLGRGVYQPGNPIEFGWVLGDVFLVLAAVTQYENRNLEPVIENQPSSRSGKYEVSHRLLSRLQSLIPLITTLLLGWYALLDWQLRGRLNPLGLWVMVVIGLGLVARQGILAGEVEMGQYANLVNSVAEPSFVCDRDGYLRLVNPALLSAVGYAEAQDILGQPLARLLPPGENRRLLKLALREGWSGEVELQCKDGSHIPVMLSLRPLLQAGSEPLALAGTAHDLSEQKRQQAALEAAYEQIATAHDELEHLNTSLEQTVVEKTASLTQAYQQLEDQHRALQELDQLKSDFVSLVSHELRAPLTNISAGIELLLSGAHRDGPRHLPENTRQTLELVQQQIHRLARFVATILDISALEAGRMPLYLTPLSLQSTVRALQRELGQIEGSERIHWQIADNLPVLLADQQALTSVLFHLIDNALKYAPQGSITVNAEVQEKTMCIRIADEGPGIPPSALPLLFDRFYRANANDAQSVYGHGLGLYIVRHLLDAMNGRIEVVNLIPHGACFTCWLPLSVEVEGLDEL